MPRRRDGGIGEPVLNDEARLSDELFGRFTKLLSAKTGIALREYKKYLVISRLATIVGPGKRFDTFEGFYQALCQETDGAWTQTFINALTTNYSFFFRDAIHFLALGQYLRDRGADEPYLRLWSAASSTGEEAYSMAITLTNHGAPLPSDRRILATDISTKVLTHAETGLYASEAVLKNVEPRDQKRYFESVDDGRKFQVRPVLREQVDFRQLNLQSIYPFRKKMDVIFLRNVMIYFGAREKAEVVQKMYDHLKPGGLLIIGLSESLAGIRHRFVSYKSSIFRKEGA